jgi:HAE1 family hydrophobic/amphiphilic exporter-1
LFNLTTLYFANTLHGDIRGLVATYYRTEGKEIETICRLFPDTIKKVEDLQMLRFVTPYREVVALNQVSDITKVSSQQEIWHKNKKRFIQISGNRRNVGLSKIVEEMDKQLKVLKFPKDYFYRFSGEYEDMVRNAKQFQMALVLTILLIYMTLASLFESYSQPFIILLSIPLGLIGVALLLWVFKRNLSLGVWIGLMMLGGIVVNSAIVMVEQMNIFRRGKGYNLKRVILQTTNVYFTEVMMTSLTTILGVLPLILNFDESSVMWRTLGLTIFGGMLFSTIFVLYIVPLAYYGFANFKEIFEKLKVGVRNKFIKIFYRKRLKLVLVEK